MELHEELKAIIENRIDPFSMSCDLIYGSKSKKVIALRTSLHINTLRLGSITEEDYGSVSEMSEQGLLLVQKALEYACAVLQKREADGKNSIFVSVRTPLSFITNAEPIEALSKIFEADPKKLEQLWLEFPSRLLPRLTDEFCEKLKAVKALGVGIVLSDFGDELCPTMKIASFPFDYVILHPSFVSTVTDGTANLLPSSLLLNFLRGLGIKVIAPELRQESDVDKVLKLGCDGYIYANKTEELLKGY